MSAMRKNLQAAGVELIGGSLDECSMAYKDIGGVMEAQAELVDVRAQFNPMVVRMAGEQKKPWQTGGDG